MRIPIALAAAVALTACTAMGPRYSEHVALEPEISRHATRIIVFRGSESLRYSGRSATVRVDGATRGECDYGGYQTLDVAPGPHVLSVDMWGTPGACSLSIDVLGGEEYFYEIQPRGESAVAEFLGAMLLGALAGPRAAGVAPLAFSGAGAATGSCAGAFSISGVEEGQARERIKGLRLSR